jgi:hypothetical protein
MEDDLMIRDILKMTTTAQNMGVKPVQLKKLKDWMEELKELADGPVHRPILPHEKRGSKLRVSKSAISQTGKEYDNAIRASRASRDMEGSYDSSSRRTSRSSKDTIGEGSVASRRSSKSSHSEQAAPVRRSSKVPKHPAAAEDLSL